MSPLRYNCPVCGTPCYADTRVCTNCGHDLSKAPEEVYDPFLAEAQAPTEKPPTHYGMAILTFIFFPLFGIFSMIHASRVNTRYDAEDYFGAQESSDAAKRWARTGLIISVVFWVAMIGLILAYAMMHHPPGH